MGWRAKSFLLNPQRKSQQCFSSWRIISFVRQRQRLYCIFVQCSNNRTQNQMSTASTHRNFATSDILDRSLVSRSLAWCLCFLVHGALTYPQSWDNLLTEAIDLLMRSKGTNLERISDKQVEMPISFQTHAKYWRYLLPFKSQTKVHSHCCAPTLNWFQFPMRPCSFRNEWRLKYLSKWLQGFFSRLNTSRVQKWACEL